MTAADRIPYDQAERLAAGRGERAARAVRNAARGVNAAEAEIRQCAAAITARLQETVRRLDHGLGLNSPGELQHAHADLDRAAVRRELHWQALRELLTEAELDSLRPPSPGQAQDTRPPAPGRPQGMLYLFITVGHLRPGDQLVYRRRTGTFTATVTADGWIRLENGHEHQAVSPAAAECAGTGTPVNGWNSWVLQRTGQPLNRYRIGKRQTYPLPAPEM